MKNEETNNKIPFEFTLYQTGNYECRDMKTGEVITVTSVNDKARIYLPVVKTLNGIGVEEYVQLDDLYLIKK